ncbi:MAG TPA: UvrD-helicase domain-containing protein [Planctomycetota bacterium]|nr:UvrD-helicase domain-containing protein [Planctomycetota bacterium]
MHHLQGLNPPQAEAVRTLEGPLLVLAGAGTGKTRVVTCRIAEIVARGTRPQAVCAVTFTNKAAKEMRERALKMLRRSEDDAPTVCTFHSLGVRLLREFGPKIGVPRGFAIADDADQGEILADALRDHGVGRDQCRPKDARWKVSGWKNGGLSPDDVLERANDPLAEKLAWAYRRYEEELERRNLVDFDDLILKPLRLLEARPEVAEELHGRFRYLLVDEYQDTNEVQYRLVRLIAGPRRNVCVVGDDDQSIYGWRGAEPDRILAFARDFPGAKTVVLDQNYRSTGAILDAANKVIGNNRARKEKRLWSALGAGDPIALYVAADDKDEMDEVGRVVNRLIRATGVAPQDVAILFRANSQCRPLEQTLRARQIPYRVVGTRSFFDRREVRDLLAYARLAANPKDDGAWIRVANTPARGIGKSSVDKLKQRAGETRRPLRTAAVELRAEFAPKAQEGFANLESALVALVDDAARGGVAAALAALVDRIQYRDHVRMDTTDALELTARLGAVDDLVSVARDFEAKASDRGLDAFLESLALREDDRYDSDRERAEVSLLTMHAAKGLEFPHVYIVGCEEGIIPHKNSVAEPGDDEDDAPVDRADRGLEEERRLFYVALTRARKKLYLSYAAKRVKWGKELTPTRSRFLDEIGDGFEIVDATSDTPASKEFGKGMFADMMARFGKKAEEGR